MALSASLGVAPRFSSAHLHIHNRAVGGAFYSFTALTSETVLDAYNGLCVMAYRRAAYALLSVPALGVSNPLATYHFADAVAALRDVLRYSRALADELDPDRFFYNIRPYFNMTASGPPLEAVLETLAQLRDLRAARSRPGLVTAQPTLDRVRALLGLAHDPAARRTAHRHGTLDRSPLDHEDGLVEVPPPPEEQHDD